MNYFQAPVDGPLVSSSIQSNSVPSAKEFRQSLQCVVMKIDSGL